MRFNTIHYECKGFNDVFFLTALLGYFGEICGGECGKLFNIKSLIISILRLLHKTHTTLTTVSLEDTCLYVYGICHDIFALSQTQALL